jgi:hypothetical protein
MKKTIITLCLSLFMVVSLFAQKEKRDKREDNEGRREEQSKNCNIPATLKITKAAYSLIESYNKLLNPTANNLCVSSNGTVASISTLPSRYYGGGFATGNINYASFVETGNLLRTIFANKASDYGYYGSCVPNPIIWDANDNAGNHVFAAKLVTIPNFVAAGNNAAFLNTTGVNIADVKSFDCIKLEEANGYAAASELANYNNVFSSKGILIAVTLKTGEQQWCYLINNYDTAGTLKWKE